MNEATRNIHVQVFCENIVLAKHVEMGLLGNRLSVCLTWLLISIFTVISPLSRTSVWHAVLNKYLLIEQLQQLIVRVDICLAMSEAQVRALCTAPNWLMRGKLWIVCSIMDCVSHTGVSNPRESLGETVYHGAGGGGNPDMRECFSGLYI